MRKVFGIVLFLLSGSVMAAEPWQAKSVPGKTPGTIETELAGWTLIHLPITNPEFLMVGTDSLPIAIVTDYPDSVEVRTANGNSGDFITVRDRDHDHVYEEIEGLGEGTQLKLDGATYKLSKMDGKWQLVQTP